MLTFVIILLLLVCLYTVTKSNKIQRAEENQLIEANKTIGALDTRIIDYVARLRELEESIKDQKQKFEKLQHQKISADVKLGGKAENLLPFLESFPYKDDEIRGMFNPIDLIVFREDEIVFIEVKSGQSQLSDKQKKIREIIENKKVRFEVHRMNEKGVKIK